MNKVKILISVLFAVLSFSFLAACNMGEENNEALQPNEVNYNPNTRDNFLFDNDNNTDWFDQDFFTNRNLINQENQYWNRGRDTNVQEPNQFQTNEQARENNVTPNQNTNFTQQVIQLTNERRKENGLEPLKSYAELTNVAQTKSEDMVNNDYFAHTSPTYGSPFQMLRDFGIDYRTAAENIAAGQRTPEEVVESWMNSPGHRRNILNQNVTHIGVGHAQDENQMIYWTQLFIGK